MREQVTLGTLRQRWNDIVRKVRFEGKRVVVTKHGAPRVAIVPIEDLELLNRVKPERG